MARGPQKPSTVVHSAVAREAELAERRATKARERAAKAGLAAAESIDESARRHERFADSQDHAIEHGIPDPDEHRESAALHREAAARDRKLAELKRKESEADLSG